MQRTSGSPGLYGCHGGQTQRWAMSRDGYIATDMVCLYADPAIGQCASLLLLQFVRGSVRLVERPFLCLEHSTAESAAVFTVQPCSSDAAGQAWTQHGSQLSPANDETRCLDSESGQLAPCGQVKAPSITPDGEFTVKSCLASASGIFQRACAVNRDSARWLLVDKTLRPRLYQHLCLDRENQPGGGAPVLKPCHPKAASVSQHWEFVS
jgi:hypothetical protein